MSVREQDPPAIRFVEDQDRLERPLARGQQIRLAEKTAQGPAARSAEAPDDEVVAGDAAPGHQAGDGRDQPRTERAAQRRGAAREPLRAIAAQGEGRRHPRGAGDQDRHAPLHSQRRQQIERCRRRAGDGAEAVEQVKSSGAPADELFARLHDGVRERKGEPHEEGRHGHELGDRSQMDRRLFQDPQTPGGPGQEALDLPLHHPEIEDIERSQGGEREGELRADPARRRPVELFRDVPAGGRAQPETHQDLEQEEGEHQAVLAEGAGQEAEPEDLHPHGGEAGEE